MRVAVFIREIDFYFGKAPLARSSVGEASEKEAGGTLFGEKDSFK